MTIKEKQDDNILLHNGISTDGDSPTHKSRVHLSSYSNRMCTAVRTGDSPDLVQTTVIEQQHVHLSIEDHY